MLRLGGKARKPKEFDLDLMLQYPVAMETLALVSKGIFTDCRQVFWCQLYSLIPHIVCDSLRLILIKGNNRP